MSDVMVPEELARGLPPLDFEDVVCLVGEDVMEARCVRFCTYDRCGWRTYSDWHLMDGSGRLPCDAPYLALCEPPYPVYSGVSFYSDGGRVPDFGRVCDDCLALYRPVLSLRPRAHRGHKGIL